ncbi:MAG: hypothetical protein ACFFDI_29635 [Promethearchaeota archaeon]
MSLKTEIRKLASGTILNNAEIAKVVGCSIRTVHRYAGSHAERCKEKVSTKSEDIFQIQKTVLLPDIHYPNYEQRVMGAVDEFIIDYEPDELVYMGDQLELNAISGWNKNKPLLKEGQRLLKEYEGFDYHILQTHENIAPNVRRVFMIGNHEQRVEWYCQEHPELKGMIDIAQYLDLEKRGYTIIPFNEIYKLGKLAVIHGFYWNKYHAAKTLDAFEGNVVYAHIHNPQMYAKVSPIDRKGYHTATALGCLCNIKPDYKKNAPNFWINQFGIVEHLPATGAFNLYPITIIEGSFMFDGKYYGKSL